MRCTCASTFFFGAGAGLLSILFMVVFTTDFVFVVADAAFVTFAFPMVPFRSAVFHMFRSLLFLAFFFAFFPLQGTARTPHFPNLPAASFFVASCPAIFHVLHSSASFKEFKNEEETRR